MEPKKQAQIEAAIALAKRLEHIMAHPEWKLITDLIDDERKFHANMARNPELRKDGSKYHDIVRALDSADAIGAITKKFDTIIRLGREAQEKLDATNGTNVTD